MILLDVNVLVYAHRADAPNHPRYRARLESIVNADVAYGMAELVLSGFLSVVTHPRVFREPTPLAAAVAFAAEVRDRPNCVVVTPGERHWEIFVRLCRETEAKGNVIADAYLAALALESGSEWITTDRDYAPASLAFAGGTPSPDRSTPLTGRGQHPMPPACAAWLSIRCSSVVECKNSICRPDGPARGG